MPHKTYTKICPTIVEALNSMKPEHMTKSKGIIEVKFNKMKAEIYLWPVQMRRLFTNKTAKELFQKRMIGALK